jgi:transposase
MAWTELTRRQHDRKGNKYASDTKTGRPRTTRLRDVFDAILYIATTGCQWRMLPNKSRFNATPATSAPIAERFSA